METHWEDISWLQVTYCCKLLNVSWTVKDSYPTLKASSRRQDHGAHGSGCDLGGSSMPNTVNPEYLQVRLSVWEEVTVELEWSLVCIAESEGNESARTDDTVHGREL